MHTSTPYEQSEYFISFVIDSFPGKPPQPFAGYLFTHAQCMMAGYTWWYGSPFGWYL